ncbi:AcrR family transcriptional regulator [Deinococcus metalli]|uniref:AcrR family transcriptional regulator n=1 Tax=Deinococcus metalli TaxID=1141878 RepID=A0A7W8KJD2_9DEIO|nr:TetR/AcrR family transcriptional regulator [Deinococcus metalli]MBB5378031.1 AcrR family transcriptional regulator [Deinococcus metalli]GHF53890.1 TetR family transcriptional regulator [Deinococcus metalli]
MPRVSQEHRDERKDAILTSAAGCFAQDGFHATSMADIIHASGLSAGSVYRYFKNKDDLIAAIVDRYLGTVIEAVVATSKRADSPADAVVESLRLISWRLHATPDEPLIRLLPQIWSEALRNDAIRSRGQELYRDLLAHFAALVRRAQVAGTLSPDLSPDATAQTMLALIQGHLLQAMLLDDIDLDAYGSAVRRLLAG